ncbi:MAG: hypothetical protein KF897_04165 [Opitutaceae bacterium]|nr:hypothetical protein [Opitutaceae bacterium]
MTPRTEHLPSGAFTLTLRLAPLGHFTGPLLTCPGEGGQPALELARTGGTPDLLRCIVRGSPARPACELVAPLGAIDSTESHKLVLRHAGHRIDLFVDGVLLDEDWPVGHYPPATGPLQTAAVVRGLEVHRGAGEVASDVVRADRYLGPAHPVGQGWKPRGHNVHVGDCMPFFHAGRFHVYYLRDRRQHASMGGCGGHQWAHLSTTDLRCWEEHPLALVIDGDTAGSVCTGSVFHHAGIFHAFHSLRMADGAPAPLCVATSRDAVHFGPRRVLATLPAPYDRQATRDPVVFPDAAGAGFHLLATAARREADGRERGCLAHFTSADLRTWDLREPFLILDVPTQPECPDYFAWRGWHYLIFSLHGIARYRKSRHPLGPWETPADDRLDPIDARVMKTAAFAGDRRLGAAFIADGDGWGGTLCLRELEQQPDGTLRLRWPAEMPGPTAQASRG